jgi:hypothetical protein
LILYPLTVEDVSVWWRHFVYIVGVQVGFLCLVLALSWAFGLPGDFITWFHDIVGIDVSLCVLHLSVYPCVHFGYHRIWHFNHKGLDTLYR